MIRLVVFLLALTAPGYVWAQSLSCSLNTALAACRPPAAEGNFKCWKCTVDGGFARYSPAPVACANSPSSGPCQALKRLLAQGERPRPIPGPLFPTFPRGTVITCIFKTQLPMCRLPRGATQVQCWQCTLHHVSPPPPAKCPYDSAGYADGCDGAPAGAQFKAPSAPSAGASGAASWAGHARQGGQTWTADHPWKWNQAGVDYAIGNVTAAAALADPATLPASGAVCVFQPAGSPTGGAQVYCSASAGATTVDLEGFDFSRHGCTYLKIASSITAITLKNDYFRMGPNCDFNNGSLVFIVGGGGASLDLESSTFDGAYPAYAPVNAPIGLLFDTRNVSPCGATVMKYLVFINSPQRPVSAGTCGSRTVAFTYFEGWQLDTTFTQHGEILQDTTAANSVVPNVTYSFVTVMAPVSQVGTMNAAAVAIFSGSANVTYASVQVDHSVFITNGHNGKVTESKGVWIGYNTFGSATWTNNYFDPSGLNYCFSREDAIAVGSSTFTNNVDLLDGSTVKGYLEDGIGNFSCNGHI